MNIVLLAAGRGLRLKDHTTLLPKSLLEVGGKPLLHHILKSLKPHSQNLTIIGGFESSQIQEQAASVWESSLNFFVNPDFKLGSILTILCAQGKVEGPFVIFNADHFYSQSILQRIFTQALQTKHLSIACDFDRPLTDDDMKVFLHEGKLQKMDKKLTEHNGGYVGVTIVPKEKVKTYWEAAHHLVHLPEGKNLSVEAIIHHLASQGLESIEAIDVSGSHWLELDTPQDLQRAQELIVPILKNN